MEKYEHKYKMAVPPEIEWCELNIPRVLGEQCGACRMRTTGAFSYALFTKKAIPKKTMETMLNVGIMVQKI